MYLFAFLQRAFAVAVLESDGVLAEAEVAVLDCGSRAGDGDGIIAKIRRK